MKLIQPLPTNMSHTMPISMFQNPLEEYPQHLLSMKNFSSAQISQILDTAKLMKASPGEYTHVLQGKSVAMLFEKPSLRTHVSFDVGIQRLGGHAVYLDLQHSKIGVREDTSDYAKNLSQWCDGIVARVDNHQVLSELSQHSDVPIVNALCDLYHPCQAMADFLTLQENYPDFPNLKFAYIGDGNNVAQSLGIVAAKLGIEFTIITPEGYDPDPKILQEIEQIAKDNDGSIQVSHNLEDLGKQDALYTDTWISMGSKEDPEQIKKLFAPYQVNLQIMEQCGAKLFLHCQPAHKGQEVSAELFDSPMSLVFQQAKNRMYVQNAILFHLLK